MKVTVELPDDVAQFAPLAFERRFESLAPNLANPEKLFGMNGLSNTAHSIIWRQLDNSGMEHCMLAADSRHVHLDGIVTASANAVPWRIEYEVICDPAWASRDAHVRAVAGGKTHDVSLRADRRGHWWVNGE